MSVLVPFLLFMFFSFCLGYAICFLFSIKILHASEEVIALLIKFLWGYMKVLKWASCFQAAVRQFEGCVCLFRFKPLCWSSKSPKRRSRSIQKRTFKWSSSSIGSWSPKKSWECWRVETAWNSTCREWWWPTG